MSASARLVFAALAGLDGLGDALECVGKERADRACADRACADGAWGLGADGAWGLGAEAIV